MKREDRIEIIKSIIRENEISTQEELTKCLEQHNIFTTQTTISRDLKLLKLTKVPGEHKKFKYAIVEKSTSESRSNIIFKQSVLSITSSQNIIVIKTYEGNASGAASFLDKLNLSTILGTISGDDTIFLAIDKLENVEKTVNLLKGYLL